MKNVKVVGIDGVVAIPDGMSKPAGSNEAYFIEVKTGNDPPFTTNQQSVYHLICTGGHATSNDPRINDLGLEPGQPFPPMKIMVLFTPGPRQKVHMLDYCDMIGNPRRPE